MSTVSKALSLLDSVSRLQSEAGLSDIARLCGHDKATTRRLLVDLQKFGFVEQDAVTRKYRIGPAPVRLARIREASFPYLRIAVPLAKELCAASQETVHVSQIDADRLFTVHTEESSLAHRVIVDMGTYLPFHATASGIAFISCCGPHRLERALAAPLERFTDHTVTDTAALRRIFAETAARGYSINRQSMQDGVVSVAAPIVSLSGEPAGAIAISAPFVRMNAARIAELGAAVSRTAEQISEKLYGSDGLQARRTAK